MNPPTGLRVEIEGPVLRAVIDAPERRNPLSLEILAGLRAAFEGIERHDGLLYAVVTGAGDKAFASGGDLHQLNQYRSAERAAEMSQAGRAALDAIRFCPIPVYAIVNGHALGGGAELALACDVRIALPHARIGFIQSTLNTCTPWGGLIDLIGLIGYGRAARCVVEGERFSAEQALALGLVEHISPDPQDILERLAERRPQVMRGFKAILAEHRRSMHQTLRPTEESQAIATWSHADHWRAHEAALNRVSKRRD